MTRPAITPWLAAIAIVMAYICMAGLDGPTDHSTEVAQAQALDDAHAFEAARQAQQARIQTACGPNAAWSERADGHIQCTTKHGRKTIVVPAPTPTVIAHAQPTRTQP